VKLTNIIAFDIEAMRRVVLATLFSVSICTERGIEIRERKIPKL
jgi:hypothetical protein